jgi:hypothetical protein
MHPGNASLPPPTFHVERADLDYAFGSVGGVLIVSWRSHVALEAVKKLVVYRNALAIQGKLLAAIHIAEENMVLPSPEARKAAEQGVTDNRYRAPACALVVQGTGFAASAIRSLGTAIFALRRGPPTRMFGTVNEGAEWLLRNTDPGVNLRALLEACQKMRAEKR